MVILIDAQEINRSAHDVSFSVIELSLLRQSLVSTNRAIKSSRITIWYTENISRKGLLLTFRNHGDLGFRAPESLSRTLKAVLLNSLII